MNHTRPTITEESISGASRAFIASVKELTPPVLDADQENRRIISGGNYHPKASGWRS